MQRRIIPWFIATSLGLAVSLPAAALTVSSVAADYAFTVTITPNVPSPVPVSWIIDPGTVWHGTGADADTKDAYDASWNFVPLVHSPNYQDSSSWGAVSAAAGSDAARMAAADANLKTHPADTPPPVFPPGTTEAAAHLLHAASSASADANGGWSSLSQVERWGTIYGNVGGTLTIEAIAVGDGLSVDLAAGDGQAYGGANVFNTFSIARFNGVNNDPFAFAPQQHNELKLMASDDEQAGSNGAVLVDSIAFLPGDYVQFRFGVNTLASVQDASVNNVPLPTAAWMLGSALLGLTASTARRRQRNSL